MLDFQEIGRTGLNQSAGYVQEEFLTQLSGFRWRQVLREMITNDPVVCAVLFAIETLIRQTSWDVKPASETNEDKKIADFVRGALFDDMSQNWSDTIADIISFIAWGWSYSEIVYKKREGESRDPTKRSRFNDGLIGWRKWSPRAQESLEKWEFDNEGGIKALVQTPAPDYISRTIPIEKALLFRTTAHKGNPEGRSIMRGAYTAWYYKTNIQRFEGIGIERELAGLPVFWIPSQYMTEGASADEKAMYEMAKKIVTSVRRDEQSGLVLPLAYERDTSNKLFDFSLLSTSGQRQIDTDVVIRRYDQRIACAVLADFILLGAQTTGSYALSTDKTRLFSIALGTFMDVICDVINRYAIPRLMRLNAMPQAAQPKLIHGEIDAPDLRAIGAYISILSGIKIEFDDNEKTWLKKQIKNMPVSEQMNP